MKFKVNVSGSTVMDGNLELEEPVTLVVSGTVTAEGTFIQATAGRVDTRTVKINDALIISGKEGRDMAARVLAENQENDLTVINGDKTG